MCGRYALTTPASVLARVFQLTLDFDVTPRYNVAPTQEVIVVRPGGKSRSLATMRWGLIPSWAKDASIGNRMINARAETVAEKPAFRTALKRRRCIIPASGFFEWQKIDAKRKQPFYLERADGEPLALAGLWESWTDPEGNTVESFTIITTESNEQVSKVHDRMPVILEPESFAAWLDPENQDVTAIQSLLKPAAEGILTMRPVSTLVNKPANDLPEVLRPLDEESGPATPPRDP